MKAFFRSSSRSLCAALAAAALAVGLAGCGGPTGIVVEVSSQDLRIPEDVDALRFRVTSASGPMVEEVFPLEGDWPHSLGIRPGKADNDAQVTIVVSGLSDGDEVIRHTLETSFIPGVESVFRIRLRASCLEVFCPGSQSCQDGRCPLGGDASMDAGMDAAMDAGGRDAGMDAGADGAIDAGMDARVDSGRDAGMDAGRDAGTDSGRDAGTDSGPEEDAGPPGPLVINEVDYDQPSTDTDEFIELLNPGSTSARLDGIAVILVNGADDAEYDRVELSGSLAPGDYLVIGSGTVSVPGGVAKVEFPSATNNVQNGSPDGIALFDTFTETLLDALSYEGSITAASFSGVAGTFDLVEGTATSAEESNDDDPNTSLARLPDGTDTDDASSDWALTTTPTPGSSNM